MPSRLNQMMLQELKTELGGADTCVFVDFTGLTGRKAADLREQLRTACGEAACFSIVKTSLARRVFAEMGKGAPAGDCLAGPTAVAYGADDPVIMVRVLAEWSKKQALLRFKGGLLQGRPLAADAVAELAKIPPKPILMGQVVGALSAPLSSFINVGQGLIRKMLGVVEALAKKQSESS